MWTFRGLALFAHRWAGLLSSVVLAVAGLTGAALLVPDLPLSGRVSGLHDSLWMGRPGRLIVLAATAAGVLLLATGLVIWWRQKRLQIRFRSGWRVWFGDLHHALGIVTFLMMLVLAGSALVAPLAPDPALARAMARLHRASDAGTVLKVVYAIGSLAFFVQGVTGVYMWWKTTRRGRP